MDPLPAPMSDGSWLIGLVALLHFALVSIGGLAPLVVFITEGQALKRGSEALLKAMHGLMTISLELAAVGAILGSGVVVALIGLRPQVLTLVFNIFFWFLVLQLFAFIGGLACQFGYYFTWPAEPRAPARPGHRTWGLFAAVLPLVPFVVFSAAAGFLNNPGGWPQSGSIWAAVFNPVTIPSLLHRAAAGLALLGMLVAVIHAVQRGRPAAKAEAAEHEAAIAWGTRLAAAALLAQVVLGILRMLVIRPETRGLLEGGSLTLVYLFGILAGLVPVAYYFTGRKRRRTVLSLLLLGLLPVLASAWLMGITRSLERGPDSIAGVMRRGGQVIRAPAIYLPAVAGGSAVDGQAVFKNYCGSCHPGLAGDALVLAAQRHPAPDDLVHFLQAPTNLGVSMPPFAGSAEELQALVAYVLDLELEDVYVEETGAEAAPPDLPDYGDYAALAWNDLGMHCTMSDYSLFHVLPPYNTLYLQVIRRGETPQLVTGGLTAEFAVAGMTDPASRTNFWDYAARYGWDLEPGVGLKGAGTAGEMEAHDGYFLVEGVPVVDTNDAGVWDPFPVAYFAVKDSGAGGQALVETASIAPVSSEMRCDLCHAGEPGEELRVTMENILQAHDQRAGTTLDEQAAGGDLVMCAGCHADPALGIMESQDDLPSLSAAVHASHDGRFEGQDGLPENECYACHPGPRTQCQRDAMLGVGITCKACHGSLADLGSRERTSWVNLPNCESCHTAALGPASVTEIPAPNTQLTRSSADLYRNRTAHGGLYCAACHGSPHAVYPTVTELDNQQSILWQAAEGPIKECTVCHTIMPEGEFSHYP